MVAADSSPSRIGRFLVELERLEQAQPSGLFLVDRVQAVPQGVQLQLLSGEQLTVAVSSSTSSIAAALHDKVPDLQVPAPDVAFPISSEPDVQQQWALLHYALGAYDTAILEEAQVQVLVVQRHGTTATVQVSRGPEGTIETYTIDLDRQIDLGLADTIAFTSAPGLESRSLNRH